MKKIILFGVAISVAPFIAFAATAFSVLATVNQILATIIPILITLAVVYFIWGVIQYTLSTDEEKKKKARSTIIQGLIGLFVIIAFWGIIGILTNTFGIGPTRLDQTQIPCIPSPSAGIYC
ncbi:MAG: hypothetical protein KGI58_03480 [Patescibacteria group bacterium]|nr:hypothetical protein [Patescibacteria group bacterium]